MITQSNIMEFIGLQQGRLTNIVHFDIDQKATITDDANRRLEVVGVPFGGHNRGKDDHGQYFSENTDIMLDIGDSRPVLYYHGRTPAGKKQLHPEVIGKAYYTGKDARGHIFDVILNKGSQLADRVWEAAKAGLAKASSGAVNYLIRLTEATGEITVWPFSELTLIDTGGMWRQPANQLATVNLKALYDTAGIDLPESFAQTGEVKAELEQEDNGDHKTKPPDKENLEMTDETKEVNPLPLSAKTKEEPIDLKTILAQVKAELKAEAAAEAARKAEIDEAVEKALADQRKEFEAAKTKAPGFNKIVGKNAESEGTDEFLHWMKTGDDGAMKVLKPSKALQEGSDTEGGYLVPDDFLARIIERRDQMSWLRQSGVSVFQTSRDVLNIPVEESSYAVFDVTAEEGTYTASDPIFNQVAVTLYKFTKKTTVSNELLDDNATNLEQFMIRKLGNWWANTECKMAAVGTGSSQPQGVFVGGTAGSTFDTTTPSVADVSALFYKLPNAYRQDAIWLCHQEVEAAYRALRDTSNWAFPGNIGVAGDWKLNTFYGARPMFNEQNCATIAASAKILLIGNFEYYALAERKGLEIMRNPWDSMNSDQTNFYAKARMGGAVLQAEAFQYGTLAAS